ncbi:hypothetical protein [Pseudomonas laurentiana]
MLLRLSTGRSAAPSGGSHQTVTELWQRARAEFIRLALYWGSAFWCFFHAGFLAFSYLSIQRTCEFRRTAM